MVEKMIRQTEYLKLERNDLINILNGDLSTLTYEMLVSPDIREIKIEVHPTQIKKMISLYLNEKIDASSLTKWAEFLCFRDEYTCINSDSDESADFYEAMWYVVQKLSTPVIDGEITPQRAREYIHELDKYF